MERKTPKIALGVTARTDPYATLGAATVRSDKFWRWGDDNLFPSALALMARRSTTHRRIINDKADYVTGKGFVCDEAQPRLAAFIRRANERESLRQVVNRLAYDKALFGNAFLEVATDPARSFLALWHQDASRCRVARDSARILLHPDWAADRADEAKSLPLYPRFERQADGTLRTMIHYKDYEPMFEHYGVPAYIAGFGASAIAYKTDRWNISRLDNSFQLSGVLMLDASVGSEAEAERIARYLFRSERECELVYVHRTVYDGAVRPGDELDGGRFWSPGEIRAALGSGVFTPNFENEATGILGLAPLSAQ